MLHTTRMVLVPEDLYTKMKSHQKPTPSLETLAQNTDEARQIRYTTAERRRRKLDDDQKQTPLLVDLIKKPKKSKKFPEKTQAPKKESQLAKEEVSEETTSSSPSSSSSANEEKKNSSEEEYLSAGSNDSTPTAGLSAEIREALTLIRNQKPSFLGPNGNSILRPTDGKPYKSSSLLKSLRHIQTPGKKAPSGTALIAAFLQQNPQILKLLKKQKAEQSGKGRVGWFRPQLWTCPPISAASSIRSTATPSRRSASRVSARCLPPLKKRTRKSA